MTRFRITDPALVPEELKCDPECSVVRCAGAHAKIRAALDQPCEECGGDGFAASSVEDEYGYEHLPACPVCQGSGLRQIPVVERFAGDGVNDSGTCVERTGGEKD